MVSASTDDSRLAELNAVLKVVGRAPRIVCGVQLIIFLLVSLPAMEKHNPFVWVPLVASAPLVAFILSWRIKAYATSEALIVRSYLRTYIARYEDILGFDDTVYDGIWTGYTAPDWWTNRWLRMLSIVRFERVDIDLPATMMGRRNSKRIVELLNAWVPDEMPPDWKP